jgi:hypothetical protein
MWRAFIVTASAMAASCICLTGAQAQATADQHSDGRPLKITDIVEGYPRRVIKRLDQLKAQFRHFGLDEMTRGIASSVEIWDLRKINKSRPLRVCFMHGALGIRKFVVSTVQDWLKHDIGLKFDFGPPNAPFLCSQKKSHIRIAFCWKNSAEKFCKRGRERGHWALVGRENVDKRRFGGSAPTMNLEGVDVARYTKRARRRIILHEFGHVLGFRHEHQNPNEKCDTQLKMKEVRKEFRSPKHGWTTEQIAYNFDIVFRDSKKKLIAKRDERSVMNYEIAPRFFRKGRQSTCYSKAAYRVSDIDYNLLRKMYPVKVSEQKALFSRRRSRIAARIQKTRGDEGLLRAEAALSHYLD